jgi:hypothetical protein
MTIISFQNSGYSNRMTTVNALTRLASVLGTEQVEIHILPVVIKGCKDVVPNVRFTSCASLNQLMQWQKVDPQMVTSTVMPCLQELMQDSDADIRYVLSKIYSYFIFFSFHAQKALNSCAVSLAAA